MIISIDSILSCVLNQTAAAAVYGETFLLIWQIHLSDQNCTFSPRRILHPLQQLLICFCLSQLLNIPAFIHSILDGRKKRVIQLSVYIQSKRFIIRSYKSNRKRSSLLLFRSCVVFLYLLSIIVIYLLIEVRTECWQSYYNRQLLLSAYPEPLVRSYPIDTVIPQHYYHEGSELDIILGVVRTAGSIFIGTSVLLMIIVIIFFFLKLITPILLILTGLILLIIIICIGLWLLGKFR